MSICMFLTKLQSVCDTYVGGIPNTDCIMVPMNYLPVRNLTRIALCQVKIWIVETENALISFQDKLEV
jgi:hypothetical protein